MVCTFPVNFFPVPATVTHQRFHFSHRFWADCEFVCDTGERFEMIFEDLFFSTLIHSLIYLNEIPWSRTSGLQQYAYFVLSGILGKQNSSALKCENPTSDSLTTKIDEEAIAPQEISKDGCDSPDSSYSIMDLKGIFHSDIFVIIILAVVFISADLSVLYWKHLSATSSTSECVN